MTDVYAFAKHMIDILGLPESTSKFVLTVNWDGQAKVDCTYHPDISSEGVIRTIRRYKGNPPSFHIRKSPSVSTKVHKRKIRVTPLAWNRFGNKTILEINREYQLIRLLNVIGKLGEKLGSIE